MSDEAMLTIEQVKAAIDEVLSGRLDDLATRSELMSLRAELNQHIADAGQTEHELRNFVTVQTSKMDIALKKLGKAVDRLNETITANRELEDARDTAQHQLIQQSNVDRLALQQTQVMSTTNAENLRRVEAELGDVYRRMIPLTFEVMGNKETGKLPLRAEFAQQHAEVMESLRAITSASMANSQRLGDIETGMVKIERRHAEEDKWLRERPRKLANAIVQAGSDLVASSLVKWVLILGGGTGLGALVVELLNALLGR